MYLNDPKLSTPVLSAIAAAICLTIAWKAKLPDWISAFLIITGVIFAMVSFVTGGDYIFAIIERHVRNSREAWYSPYLRLTQTVSQMTPAQLAFIQEVVPLKMIGKFGAGDELSWWVSAPRGDVPLEYLSEYLEKCEADGWETLIPQHGMSDTMEREYVARIHELMTYRGFATRQAGNLRAKWLVAPEVIYSKLGLTES